LDKLVTWSQKWQIKFDVKNAKYCMQEGKLQDGLTTWMEID